VRCEECGEDRPLTYRNTARGKRSVCGPCVRQLTEAGYMRTVAQAFTAELGPLRSAPVSSGLAQYLPPDLAREAELCPECDGTGLVEDPTACGDPDHCPGWMPCPRGCPEPE
jgi:hypothetical protein